MPRIFLVGPGGVGKTTVGRLLAPMLRHEFVDLDEEFCNRVAPIRDFLDEHGYPAYVRRNSELLGSLLSEDSRSNETVFALSSGFLVTDVESDTLAANRRLIEASGVVILLLPSENLDTSLRIVVERQLKRGLGLRRDSEIRTFHARFEPYRRMGHIKIFSTGAPKDVAHLIHLKLSSVRKDAART